MSKKLQINNFYHFDPTERRVNFNLSSPLKKNEVVYKEVYESVLIEINSK